MQTTIRINQMGRMGNHMAQLMFARSVQRLSHQPVAIEGYNIPAWGLDSPRKTFQRTNLIVGSNLTRTRLVARMIDAFKPALIDLDGVILRVGNLLPPEYYSDLFPLIDGEGAETLSGELLIHIRLGDVLNPSHPHYGPLPVSYYQYLVDHTGLSPVFMGELDDGPYLQHLMRAFPNAQFRVPASTLFDFQTLMRAKNIAVSVSSFAWLAAYLSRASLIFVPVAGMLNPKVRPDIDLLPRDDNRFQFFSISDAAWNNRYTDFSPPVDQFKRASVVNAARLAIAKSFVVNSRIHLGLARRMMARPNVGGGNLVATPR